MAIPYEFQYEKPLTLAEAVGLKSKYGKEARLLAGGTDVANEMKQGFRVPSVIIDIKGVEELKKIDFSENTLKIGALVTFNDIRESALMQEKMYILWEAAGLVASNGVRNRATMVGNICSAVACMDSASPLLVHDAIIHTISADGERQIPVQQWFVDNRKTAINDNELVTHISVKLPSKKYAGAYQKMMRYSGEDLSQSNVGILVIDGKQFKVAFGAVGPTPKHSLKLENLLNTKGVSKETIDEAKQMIETVIAPISDVRATKEYRMHMTKVMFERALNTALERYSKPTLITK